MKTIEEKLAYAMATMKALEVMSLAFSKSEKHDMGTVLRKAIEELNGEINK
jgi:hypothetical protein